MCAVQLCYWFPAESTNIQRTGDFPPRIQTAADENFEWSLREFHAICLKGCISSNSLHFVPQIHTLTVVSVQSFHIFLCSMHIDAEVKKGTKICLTSWIHLHCVRVDPATCIGSLCWNKAVSRAELWLVFNLQRLFVTCCFCLDFEPCQFWSRSCIFRSCFWALVCLHRSIISAHWCPCTLLTSVRHTGGAVKLAFSLLPECEFSTFPFHVHVVCLTSRCPRGSIAG